ncbi:carbohydrate ABC transporter permease [Microlunatus soli]|uniref:Carbohydrate ABC transporter membrane protein 1, CUT1 family n=1 Tax=Microlunatus soli TaxID=630515 RepID=A0A1H1N3W2_9ACTN|nr:sugar ABC transporter permease [Microlunatus soli]SDR93743.1 carbohydrate ABC transporter membrane protein 1, CUT1 family [Microlunatus soli]
MTSSAESIADQRIRPGRQQRRWGRTARRGVPLVPAVALLLLFMAGPVIYSIYLAFTNSSIRGEGANTTDFVGLENFGTALAEPEFWKSVGLTLAFTMLSAVIGQNLLGLLLAIIMRRSSKIIRSVTGAVVIAAWILPEVVAGYLWVTFLDGDGSFNAIMKVLHLPQQDWLVSLPIWAVAFANIWRGAAFSMLIYTAALAGISPDIKESAELDGAGVWRRFLSMTVPMIRQSIATNLMLITLQTLSVFGLIYIMTAGGPANDSQTLPLYMYERAFSYGQLGYGTAIALLLLLIGGLASIAYLRLLPAEDKS